jgi:hypothetical protein
VWEDGEYRFTRRTLHTPDGDPTETDTGIMGVTREAPASITDGLVLQLETEGQKESEDTLEKRLPIAQQLKVRCFISKIDGNGAVFSCLFGGFPPVSPPVLRSCEFTRNNGEKFLKYQE